MNDETLFTQPEDSIPVPKPSTSGPQFEGNTYDVMAFVGVVVGGITLLSCGTLGIGYYCLPVLPIILGVIGLLTAKDSLNPERTRLLSWISVGTGGVIFLLILLFIGLYIALLGFGIAAGEF